MKTLKLDDSTEQFCSVSLYRNVKNCPDIKSRLLKGEIDATILNASLIPDILQVFIAANKAAVTDLRGKKLTRTIHTEVLYNLSPTRKVSESLKIFGIDDSVHDLIVVVFHKDSNGETKMKQIEELIDGESVGLEQLSELTNWKKIISMHGLPETFEQKQIIDLITSKSSCKDFLQ